MQNFYRRFLPNAAFLQAPLHEVPSGQKVRNLHPITWTAALDKSFEECKSSLSQATLLAHPDSTSMLALVTDASTTAMGAVLQQRAQEGWQPLAFFSRKLSPAEHMYSKNDREHLAIYVAIRHFLDMLESRNFIAFTDHKPLIYAFHKKRDKFSPWQFIHLDFISHFTTDIRHFSGQDKSSQTLSPESR